MQVNDYRILRDNQCSLQETSKDKSGSNPQYMTTCRKKVINFDKVKTVFLNSLNQSEEKAHSVDALVMEKGENYYIEFKNGDARTEKHEIRDKAKDSLIILNSILNRQITDSRKTDVFVLVYNEEKTMLTYKEQIATAKAKKAKKDFILFGLEKMEGFCFSKVMTVNKSQFDIQVIEPLGW